MAVWFMVGVVVLFWLLLGVGVERVGKVAGEVREERRGGWKIHGEHSHKSVWLIIHAKTVRGGKKIIQCLFRAEARG